MTPKIPVRARARLRAPRDAHTSLPDDEWTPVRAEREAAAAGLSLGPEHWRVIGYVRELAATHGLRATDVYVSVTCCGAEELSRLFPGDAVALLARIAGVSPHG